MFTARCIIVSFSVFVIVYCFLSLAVAWAWQLVWMRRRRFSIRRTADFLFVLRMLPFVTAAMITAAFTVPSFLLLEPRTTDESLGGLSLALGVSGMILLVAGLMNAGTAWRRASRAVTEWMRGAEFSEFADSVPVLKISPIFPSITVTGILRPRILLSGAAVNQLTGCELQAALNHELAHVRRADNLKKLLMRLIAFPGMRRLEAVWLETTEMAADDVAVSTTREALDLAAALIKLSRAVLEQATMDPTTALVYGPASAVHARVERLLAWNDEHDRPMRNHSAWYRLTCLLAAASATIAIFVMTYSQLLAHLHVATEWLVN
jgi:beta-lactamase regulating signal transducer with metallopeptidase domain